MSHRLPRRDEKDDVPLPSASDFTFGAVITEASLMSTFIFSSSFGESPISSTQQTSFLSSASDPGPSLSQGFTFGPGNSNSPPLGFSSSFGELLVHHSPVGDLSISNSNPTLNVTTPTMDDATPPISVCSICLSIHEDVSHPNKCLHEFCFNCILDWSKVNAQCPLCRRSFTSIIHNVRSNEEYDEHKIPVGYLTTWEPGVPHPGPSLALLHLRDSVRVRVRQTPRSDPLLPGRSSQTSPRALLLQEERRAKQEYHRLRFSSEVAPAPTLNEFPFPPQPGSSGALSDSLSE